MSKSLSGKDLGASEQPSSDEQPVASKSVTDTCPKSLRADGDHSWHFDGDDPYILCLWCHERRDALTGKTI